MARAYGFDRHNYAVVDHLGIIRYRSTGSISRRLNRDDIRAAIEDALNAVVAEPEFVSPDFDGDGLVGFIDFFLFADAFGSEDARFDLDQSGRVDFFDLFILADYFNQTIDN